MAIIGGKYFGGNHYWRAVGFRNDGRHNRRGTAFRHYLRLFGYGLAILWWTIISIISLVIITSLALMWFNHYGVINWLVDTIYSVVANGGL